MAIHPPQATVTGYTLTPYTVSTSIDTLLTVIEFSFERKMIWTTLSQIFADQGFETMPQQEIEAYEFVLHKPNATATEIAALESFLDAHFGAAVPFHFTAPDDGVLYSVQFKEDKIQYSNPAAGYTPVLFTLVTAGDVAGTLDNSLVYPSYITLSPGPGTSGGGGGGGGGGATPATGTVRTNLIAEYLMVGGSGTTIPDTSGNSHTATLGPSGSTALMGTVHAADYGLPTWLDTGLSFSDSAHSVVTLPDNSIVDASLENFSAEIWLYPLSQGGGDAAYFFFGDYNFYLQDRFNASFFWPLYNDSSVSSTSVDFLTVPGHVGFAWGSGPYQITVTRDPAHGNMLAYVNGALSTSFLTDYGGAKTFSPTGMAVASNASGPLRLIGNSSFWQSSINSVLGEMRFYGRTLSASEVLQNFNARKAFYGLA